MTKRRTGSSHRRNPFGRGCVVTSNGAFQLLRAVALVVAFPVYAQEQLSLHDAVQVAVKQNKAVQASRASVEEARMMDHSHFLQQRTMKAFAARPRLFADMLAMHEGQLGPTRLRRLRRC